MSARPFSIRHDLHCHSNLSICSTDPNCTPKAIYKLAQEKGYEAICLTDHLWDEQIPCGDDFYRAQGIAHVLQGRPKTVLPGVRCLFGCETDYDCEGRLGLSREHYDLFDFIVIPPNHMHFKGMICPRDVTTPAQMAAYFTRRLEEISQLDVPMERVGIAHLTCSLLYLEGDIFDVISRMDEARLRTVFERFARRGAGIELNAYSFWRMDENPDVSLRLYRIAKEAGCKFYCASDAHSIEGYAGIEENLPRVIEALGLTEDDRYIIPARS